MNVLEAKEFIEPFFYMKEQEILDKFISLSSNSIYIKAKHLDHRSVFVPGKRKDAVLLVAHVDTIAADSPKLKVGFGSEEYPVFFSDTRIKTCNEEGNPVLYGLPIGADDRAGVAALWYLKDLGHSLLVTNGEEYGTLGSRYLMSSKKMAAIIQNHQFMIQFDRRGSNDYVTYEVGTKEFRKFIRKQTGYSYAPGTFTDIAVLARDICGVNLSIGYYGEHTPNEILIVPEWINTVEIAKNLLSQENLPKFKL